MSDETRYIIESLLNDIKSGQEQLFREVKEIKQTVSFNHSPRLDDLERAVPSETDIEKMRQIYEAFGNWTFLFKALIFIGGALTSLIGAIYVIVKLIKGL